MQTKSPDSVTLALSSERGMALPVALAMLFLVAGLSAVAAKAGVVASHQSLRDRSLKRAVQAAGAGVRAVTYQMNLMQPRAAECVARTPGGTLTLTGAQGDGWCPPQTEEMEDGATYTVRTTLATTMNANGQVLARRNVVATGTVNGVKRRVLVTTTASTSAPVFPLNYAAVSLSSVDIGNSVQIEGGLGSNGNITLRNNAVVCGPVTAGPDKTLTFQNSASACPGFSLDPAVVPFNLPPVDQHDAPIQNDNARICASGAASDTCTGNIIWNADKRTLTIHNTGTVTLTGNVYSLCRLEIRNYAQLRIAARTTPLKIYMDTPEACGSASGMGSVKLENNSSIVNVNEDPTTFQLYASGSATKPTSIDFENVGDPAPEVSMAIYAPQSTISMKNNTGLIGAVAGKSVQMGNSSRIVYDDRTGDITATDQARVYKNPEWVECTSAQSGAAADSGC